MKELTAQEANEHIAAGDVVVIDVRSKDEHNAGHIKGSTNIDIAGADFAASIKALPKDKSYLVYCASGGRSSRAAAEMERQGFPSVINLSGGIAGWRGTGLPVETPPVGE